MLDAAIWTSHGRRDLLYDRPSPRLCLGTSFSSEDPCVDADPSLRIFYNLAFRLDPERVFQFQEGAIVDVGAAFRSAPFCHLLDPMVISFVTLETGR